MNEATWHWNTVLFARIHATADSPEWLVRTARVLADAPLMAAGLLILLLVWYRDEAHVALRVVLACILVAGMEMLIRMVADQPRPFETGLGTAWLTHAPNNAMPSTHVGLAWAAAAVALIGGHTRIAAVLLVLGMAMGWARIYVGIQWPADIAASAIAACLAAAGSLAVERAVGSFVRAWSRRSAGAAPHRGGS